MTSELQVRSTWRLELSEVSSLALAGSGRRRRLLAVGDEAYGVASTPVPRAGRRAVTTYHDLRAVLGPAITGVPGGSEFEGVTCDAGGHVFVLQEGPSRVLVLGPRLDALRATIELEVDPARPGYGAAWRADANARGESLQVLPNGHLLVAKQKDPVVLVEFGPAGDAPVGLASAQLGRSGEPFRFRAESPYVVLADWQVAAGAGVRSLNDLSVDDAGRLYCVSSRSRTIVRFARGRASPDRPLASTRSGSCRRVFAGTDRKAEGLVVQTGPAFLVAFDSDRPELDNLALAVPGDG